MSSAIRRSVRDYWRNLLAALIDENVQYLESRSVGIDEAIVRDARGRDPDFGVRFIAAGGTIGHARARRPDLKAVVDLRVKEPDRVAGFDLVEEEDRNNTQSLLRGGAAGGAAEAERARR